MADLKKSIVIVNEYTIKPKSGGKGSRGSTPGQYVLRYMARELATETLAPIRRTPIEDFTIRYMARESATERAVSVSDAKTQMKTAQGEGGVAFGYGRSSLADAELKAGAKDIQRWYDDHHTVLKTVISFDQDYLKEKGIVDPDFEVHERGDYRGHIDQMKLRLAVMAGLDRMSRGRYDDLRYVGVIQVDTEHVHCHLSMVDAGRGQLAEDGTQRGKIDARSKSLFRRGVDAWLDEKQTVKHLSSAVGYEKRNVTTYVKRWAHHQMLKESLPQFLLACLPEDRRLWRAGTNDKRMRKPNAIVNHMVEEMLSRPESPMAEAMSTVHAYANERRENERLTQEKWKQLVDHGREEIVGGAVNSVYALLRALPEDALRVRTPMLDSMSMDFEEMAEMANRGKQVQAAAEDEMDPMVDFGFKLRSYANRLEHHKAKRQENHELVNSWDVAQQVGAVGVGAEALRRFYEEEEEYHAMLSAKYQKFLPFVSQSDGWYEEWEQVASFGERVLSLEMMTKDQSLRQLKSEDEAEARGLAVYGQKGGSLLTKGESGRAVLEGRAERARATYDRKVEDLRVSLASRGLRLSVTEVDLESDEVELPAAPESGAEADLSSLRPVAQIEPGLEYEFEDVKGLDMHHMRYDFASDVPVGHRTRSMFIERARMRSEALEDAVAYLEGSGQSELVSSLPVAEIGAMSSFAATLSATDPVLPSRIAELARQEEAAARRRSRTVALGLDVAEQIDAAVATTSREALARVVPAEFRLAGVEPELDELEVILDGRGRDESEGLE